MRKVRSLDRGSKSDAVTTASSTLRSAVRTGSMIDRASAVGTSPLPTRTNNWSPNSRRNRPSAWLIADCDRLR
nr:hypothetical protein [Sphingomonas sp. 66-10]